MMMMMMMMMCVCSKCEMVVEDWVRMSSSSFCDRCECQWQRRNTTVIKVIFFTSSPIIIIIFIPPGSKDPGGLTSHSGQLSLAIHLWVGTVGTTESWVVIRHAVYNECR